MTRKRWRRLGIGGAFALVGWLVASLVVADRLTGRRRAPFAEPAPSVDWASSVADVRLSTDDGESLGAWLFSVADPRGGVVLLHGNGDSRRNLVSRAEMAGRAGFEVLAVSLRCHGDSTGERNDFGRSSAADVAAAVAFLEARGRPVVVHGVSLGAAAALFAARRLGNRVRGYLLECPYRDLRSAVSYRTDYYLPPGFSHLAYAGLVGVSGWFVDDVDGIAPIDRVADVPAGVGLVMFGSAEDRRAPLADLREMAGRAVTSAEVVAFATGRHARLHVDHREALEAAIAERLRAFVPR